MPPDVTPGPWPAVWDRASAREQLERRSWDVVVVGGGVHGIVVVARIDRVDGQELEMAQVDAALR